MTEKTEEFTTPEFDIHHGSFLLAENAGIINEPKDKLSVPD